MKHPIQDILIVGNGIAAWLSACYLSRALNAENKTVQIKLLGTAENVEHYLESTTVANFNHVCAFLGLNEMHWMEESQASFSLGSRFDNWSGKTNADDYFWKVHGSIQANREAFISLAQHWLHDWTSGLTNLSFSKALFSSVYLCELDKSPKRAFSKKVAAIPPYGFHFDASSFTTFLRQYTINAGVEIVNDIFADTILDESGKISHVISQGQQKINADLFIDCTDSRRSLINHIEGNTFTTSSSPTNRVVVAKRKLESEEIIKPYQTNKAVENGWITETPNRKYTEIAFHFNTSFLDDEKARDFLLSSYSSLEEEVTFFSSEYGSMEKHWVGNCVAIGSAAAYFEPLVPINISLIQLGLNHLIYHFPNTSFDSQQINQFNLKMTNHCNQINDFLSLNYKLTERNESLFWKSVQHDLHFSEQVNKRLTDIQENWDSDFYPKEVFQLSDYLSICAGHSFLAKKSLPILEFYQIDRTFQRFQQIVQHGKILQTYMKSQNDYFNQLMRFKEFQNKKF